MTQRQWKIIIGLNLLIIILILLPFLPGPEFLFSPAQFIYNAAQIAGIVGLFFVSLVIVIWTTIKSRIRRKDRPKQIGFIAILLLTLSAVSFLTSIFLAYPARSMSRKIAMSRADVLISAIENYKKGNGKYPNNLAELKQKYLKTIPSTLIIGIPKYGYKKTERSYKVGFTQNVTMSFNYEVVEYDPTDNHKAKGEMRTLYDCGREHWKYYIYD